MMRTDKRWFLLLAGLFLFVNGCSKKDENKPIEAVKGPVEAPKPVDVPADVVAWLVAGSPQQFIGQAEKLAAKAGPVPAGTLAMGINAALVDLGLKDTSVIDLSKPAGLMVLNPKKYPQGLVMALTTKGQKAVSEALQPTWKHKGEKEGVHQFSRESLDTYSAFQGGKATAKTKEQSLFVRFVGPTALVGPDAETLKAGGELLLERLKAGAPAQGLSGQMRVDHLRTIFGMEMAMMPEMVKQQMKQGFSQPGVASNLPDPKSMEWMAGWFVDKIMALINQTRAVGFAVGLDDSGGVMHYTVEPEKDSFFSKLLAAQKKAPLSLDQALPQDAFLAMALNVQWGLVKDDMLAFTVEMFQNMMGLKDSQDLQQLTRDFLEVIGSEMAIIEDLGPQGRLRVVELIEVTDDEKARASMSKLLALTSSLLDESKTGIMGIRMSYEGPTQLDKYKDVALEKFEIKMDMEALPEAQAKMMEKMYGQAGIGFVMAVFDKKMAVAIGDKAADDVRAVIDRVRDKKAGLTTSPVFKSAAGGLEKGAGGYMFMSLTRLMSFSIQNTLALSGNDVQLPELPVGKSGLFVRFASEGGQLVTTLRMPTEHLEELGKMIQSLSQISGGQAH